MVTIIIKYTFAQCVLSHERIFILVIKVIKLKYAEICLIFK